MRLDSPDNKLAIPLLDTVPPPSTNRFPPDHGGALEPRELAGLQYALERKATRRQTLRAEALSLYVDGEPWAEFEGPAGLRFASTVPSDASSIEVFGYDGEGPLLLAVFHIPDMLETEASTERHWVLPHEGGPTLTLTLQPVLTDTGDVTVCRLQLTYEETTAQATPEPWRDAWRACAQWGTSLLTAWRRSFEVPRAWGLALGIAGVVLLGSWILDQSARQSALQQELTRSVYKLAWANAWLASATGTLTAHDLRKQAGIAKDDTPLTIAQRAENYFRRAIALNADAPERALYTAALTYQVTCAPEKARELLQEALRQPHARASLEAQYALGEIYHILREYPAAILAYQQVIQEGPSPAVAQAAFRLAAVYAALFQDSGSPPDEAYVHRALEALQISVTHGGSQRLQQIRTAQQGRFLENEPCPGYNAPEDLSSIAPALAAWLAQLADHGTP